MWYKFKAMAESHGKKEAKKTDLTLEFRPGCVFEKRVAGIQCYIFNNYTTSALDVR